MTTPSSIFAVERAPGFALKVACKKESNDSCQCLLIPIAYRLQCSATARLTSVIDNTSAIFNACQPTRNSTSGPLGDKGNWLSSILIYNAQLELPGFRAVSSLQVSCMLDQSSNFEECHLISPGPLIYWGILTCLDAPSYKHSLPVRRQWWELGGAQLPTSPEHSESSVSCFLVITAAPAPLSMAIDHRPRTCKRVLQ